MMFYNKYCVYIFICLPLIERSLSFHKRSVVHEFSFHQHLHLCALTYLVSNLFIVIAEKKNYYSDQAMKQFLLHLDETLALGKKFIIQDLDDTHLFISADIVETLQARVDDLMDQISFSLADKGL